MHPLSFLLPAALLTSAAPAADGEWNRFRGPNGSGVAAAAKPPLQPGPENLAWKTSVPRGLSSPVLAGGRIFLTGFENGRLLTIACNAADGKERWRAAAPEVPLEKCHEMNGPATPTPCADAERVVVYFGSFGLLCYDHSGRELWRKPLPVSQSLYGAASSPILHGANVIITLDNDANLPGSTLSQSRLVGVQAATGAVVWEAARPLVRSGWSTPAVWKRGGDADELVVLGSGRVTGYDPLSGLEKWTVGGFARETIAVPVFGNDRAFVASAMGGLADEKPDPAPLWQAMLHFDADADGRIARQEATGHFTFPLRPEVPPGHPGFGIPLPADAERKKQRQEAIFDSMDQDRDGFWTRDEFTANLGPSPFRPRLVAIRPGAGGAGDESRIDWELNRSVPEIPSPVFHNGRLYLLRNGGILSAVNATDGRILYSQRLGADGQYSASPVIAGDHLYAVSNRGILTVVRTGDAFHREHQSGLGESCTVTPALDAETLYIRTDRHLLAFRRR